LLLQSTAEGRKAILVYNTKTDEYVDMLKAGIIDPKKCLRACRNTASVTGMILTTECTLIDKEENRTECQWSGSIPGMM
jgi:chaperonin GroEL